MKLRATAFCIAIALLFTSTAVRAQETDGHASTDAVQQLSPELRTLLRQEMLALQGGMQDILPWYAAGNLQEIQALGKKIRNSFILKQKLTETQAQELHRTLPQEFIAMDRRFHAYAGKLSQAAGEGDRELVGFYYSRMIDACADCHAKFATHRFPLLKPDSQASHHH